MSFGRTVTSTDPPDDVVCVSLPTPWPIGPVNAYLFRGDPLTLVDCGPRTPQALRALEDGLAAAGVALAAIELLILTHQHQDHIGNASAIVGRSRAKVAAFAPLADELGNLDAMFVRQHAYLALLMERHGMSARELRVLADRERHDRRYAASVRIDVPLRHGDLLRAGSRTFRVHHRPGHSPSDIVLFDEAHGLLVAGDHLLPEVSSNPIAHMPLSARDVNLAADERTRPRPLREYLDSLVRTSTLEVRDVLPGHGSPFSGARALIAARIALHDARADDILRALTDRPQSARDLVDVLWDDLPTGTIFLGMCEVLAHLDILADRDKISTEVVDGTVRNRPVASRRSAA